MNARRHFGRAYYGKRACRSHAIKKRVKAAGPLLFSFSPRGGTPLAVLLAIGQAGSPGVVVLHPLEPGGSRCAFLHSSP